MVLFQFHIACQALIDVFTARRGLAPFKHTDKPVSVFAARKSRLRRSLSSRAEYSSFSFFNSLFACAEVYFIVTHPFFVPRPGTIRMISVLLIE